MKQTPNDYQRFAQEHSENELYLYPRKRHKGISLRTWQLFSAPKTFSEYMDIKEAFKKFINVRVDVGEEMTIPSTLGFVHPKRLINGFLIGKSQNDYLYIDPYDQNSVWIFFKNCYGVQKVAESFQEWINDSESEITYVSELLNDIDVSANKLRAKTKSKRRITQFY